MHQSDIGCNTFIGEQTMLIRKSRPTEFCKQSGFRVKNEVRVCFKVLRAIDFQYLVVLCGLYFNGEHKGQDCAAVSLRALFETGARKSGGKENSG